MISSVQKVKGVRTHDGTRGAGLRLRKLLNKPVDLVLPISAELGASSAETAARLYQLDRFVLSLFLLAKEAVDSFLPALFMTLLRRSLLVSISDYGRVSNYTSEVRKSSRRCGPVARSRSRLLLERLAIRPEGPYDMYRSCHRYDYACAHLQSWMTCRFVVEQQNNPAE
jgi:hypothetical protein